MIVRIPVPLLSYTGQRSFVEATGTTVEHLLADLERKYPGICFRMVDERNEIRPHIRIFVNQEQVDDLDRRLLSGDEIQILQALSGG